MNATHSHFEKNTERGGALTGIVVIILILLIGGYYFYITTKRQNEENKAARERALLESSVPLDATALGATK